MKLFDRLYAIDKNTKIIFLMLLITMLLLVIVLNKYQHAQIECNQFWRDELIKKHIIANDTWKQGIDFDTKVEGNFSLSALITNSG